MPTSSSMGVKANLPGQERIIGRKQQITEILQNIIQVPNENGIIYGPGGVGKTALLLELARHLFEEGFYDQTCFKNIIWVSAKENYYNPILDVVEPGEPRIKSLDNVLTAILDFHEFEDPSGYDRESKKWLVLELFREEETLLILDNLESVISSEQEEIIHFFGGDVKRELRDKPSNFKILITSRENIPSSFRQMVLKGLDKNESKELMDRVYQPYTSSKPQLPEEQRNSVYEATKGIPLIIKHCYGQLYEYNQPLDNVLRGLSLAGNRVIEFSFSEMIKFLQEDELQLRLILLLEIINRPIMLRHMADILLQSELEIGQRLARLVSYQCVEKTSVGTDDKYSITSEARSFTRRLIQEHEASSVNVKKLIANLTIEKRLDYSKDEYEAVMQFQQYLIAGHYLPAEVFIKEKLRDRPDSLVLNLEYAKYLKNQKNRTPEAIERLESILARSGNDPQILRLLMVYYTALDDPNYAQADIYARELADVATGNVQMDFELARFYGSWSTTEKLKFELDPNREALRQQRYKELADKAIKILNRMTNRSYERDYLLAQAYYNRWDYEPALRHIDRAIEILPQTSHLGPPYRRLRAEIVEKQGKYSNRRR